MIAPRVTFALLLIASLLGTTALAQAALLNNNKNPEAEKKEDDVKPQKQSDEKKDDKKKSQKNGDEEASLDSADKKRSRDKSPDNKSSDEKQKDASREKQRDEKKPDNDQQEMKRAELKDENKQDDKKQNEKNEQDAQKDSEKQTEKQHGEPTPAMKPEGNASDQKTPAEKKPESKSALEKKPSAESAKSEEPSSEPEAKPEEKKIDRNKFAVTDLAQVDGDFWLQGEYFGKLRRPDGVLESTGIQVVARGNGKFIGRQLRGGLPGNGWNNSQKIDLAGQREGDRLTLRHEAGFQVVIEDGKATVSNSSGDTLGVLAKVQRRSKMIGLQPTNKATVLFDGSETEHFVNAKIDENGLLQIGTVTKDPVQDFRLHIEFRLPYMPYATGQARANSGLYIQERYEVQILDSFGLPGEFNECGSLYRTKPPEVNMCFPPLVWQTYDVYFTAARFDEKGNKISPARISVLHNGILVQDNYELPNKTGAGKPESPEARPIKLQDHGNPVVFRNVWIERPEELVEVSSAETEQRQIDSIELRPAGEPLPRP